MGLDQSKLENVRHYYDKITARCPACAELGKDRKGDHLFIEPGGRFGCVVYQGHDGRHHRKRISELAGVKIKTQHNFKVRKPQNSPITEQIVIKKNLLGCLGQGHITHAYKQQNDTNNNK